MPPKRQFFLQILVILSACGREEASLLRSRAEAGREGKASDFIDIVLNNAWRTRLSSDIMSSRFHSLRHLTAVEEPLPAELKKIYPNETAQATPSPTPDTNETRAECPATEEGVCNKAGQCLQGMCFCFTGYGGASCEDFVLSDELAMELTVIASFLFFVSVWIIIFSRTWNMMAVFIWQLFMYQLSAERRGLR